MSDSLLESIFSLAIIWLIAHLTLDYTDLEEAQINVECAAFYSEKMRGLNIKIRHDELSKLSDNEIMNLLLTHNEYDEKNFIFHLEKAEEYFGKENTKYLVEKYSKIVSEKKYDSANFQEILRQCNTKKGYFGRMWDNFLTKANNATKWFVSLSK